MYAIVTLYTIILLVGGILLGFAMGRQSVISEIQQSDIPQVESVTPFPLTTAKIICNPCSIIRAGTLFFHLYPLYLHCNIRTKPLCISFHSLPIVKCGGFFYLCIKSNEYGTSKSPSTLHYLRCRNTRYDDSHLGNTRNYLFLQTQRFQVPYEGRTQRQRPARHRQGSMVRKQNERTLLLHSRIIPLSLHS